MSMFMPTATGGPANQQDGPQCDLHELNSFLPELAGLRRRRNETFQQNQEVRRKAKSVPHAFPPPPSQTQAKAGARRSAGNVRSHRIHPVRPPPAVAVLYVTRTHVLAAGLSALRRRMRTQGERGGWGPAGGQPGWGGSPPLPPPRPGSAAPAPASAAATRLATLSPPLWQKGQPRGRRPVSPGGGGKGTPTTNASEIN